jgi:ubiquinone/menaquinone biosynthesis C-methylase UbiE
MNLKQSDRSLPDTEIDIREIKTFYDSVYHANAQPPQRGNNGHYRRLFRKLGIKPKANILDVACGTGAWLKVCSDNGCTVSGVDLSDNAIAACTQSMPQGRFHAQPAETLPFADGEFDLVSCLGSLEHFVDPVSSLREMVRVAKPDSTFVILVPNKDFLTRKLGLFGGTYQVDAKEVVRTLEEWQALFSSAGLVVNERWKDLHVLNRHWIMQGRFYAWPFRLLQSLLLVIWPLKWQYQVYHRCIARSNPPRTHNLPDVD